MRGDSIRDLYAKTLALLGLGVIAGTGALFDYWPVGISTPAVTTATRPIPLPGPLVATEVGVLAPAPAALARTPGSPLPVVAGAQPADGTTAAAVRAGARQLPIAMPAVLPLAATVQLQQPELRLKVEALVARGADEPGPREMLPQLIADLVIVGDVETPAGMPRAHLAPTGPEAAGHAGEGDGLIAGAFKKAGGSIASAAMTGARTGARTGASIFDTFRMVSGAVRRALPGD